MSELGRPTVMTPDVLHKLEEAFAIGCSDSEACSYADIAMSTLYSYQEKNPSFSERKEQLKEKPILKAKNTIVKALNEPEHAKWYLERKKKNEFAQRSELTGKDGKDLPTPILQPLLNVQHNDSDAKDNDVIKED